MIFAFNSAFFSLTIKLYRESLFTWNLMHCNLGSVSKFAMSVVVIENLWNLFVQHFIFWLCFCFINYFYVVLYRNLFISRDHFGLRHHTIVALKFDMAHKKMMCAPVGRITVTYGPYNCTSCAGNRDLHTYFVSTGS